MTTQQSSQSVQLSREFFLTAPELMRAGWTESLIRKHLGNPDATYLNPYYPRRAAPARLFLRDRVQSVQATDNWERDYVKSQRRRRVLRETKNMRLEQERQETIAIANAASLHVDFLPLDVVIEKARCEFDMDLGRCLTFNEHQEAVNYIRHRQTAYDAEVSKIHYRDDETRKISCRAGFSEGFIIINEKVYSEIAAKYPSLAEECQRQLNRKKSRKKFA